MMLHVLFVLATFCCELIAATLSIPNGHAWGCMNISKDLPFCDENLSVESRLDDLIGRLSVEEKIGLMSADSRTKVNRYWC